MKTMRSRQRLSRRVSLGPVEFLLPRCCQSPECKLFNLGSRRSDLLAVASRLFEVVADDLVLLDQMRVCVEPDRELLVQFGPHFLRERLVGRVADEQVPEPECVVPGKGRLLGPDQLFAHESE